MLKWFYDYIAHPQPVARAANVIAILILSNQPFYPFYIYYIAGNRFWPSLLTLLSSPLFAAVPWVMRRNAVAGKSLLMIAAIGNTVLSTWALGAEAGLELFLLPCVALGALIFGAHEKRHGIFFAGLPIVLFLILRGRYGAPLVTFSGAENSTLLTLHAVSAGAITFFICITLARALREER